MTSPVLRTAALDSSPGSVDAFRGLPGPAPSDQLLARGAKGLLQNSESLYGSTKRATVKMIGQNGLATTPSVPLDTSCGRARHKRYHKGHVHRHRKAA